MQQKEKIRYEYTQGYEDYIWHFQTNKKLFVTVHPKNACKLEFYNHLWPTISRSHTVRCCILSMIFQLYKKLVTQWKHVVIPNNIIKFNEHLENV